MNTWVLGNAPVCHQVYTYPQSNVEKDKGYEICGDKTFFMKERIMAGQVDLKANKCGIEDFRWLAREEMQEHLSQPDYAAIKSILGNR